MGPTACDWHRARSPFRAHPLAALSPGDSAAHPSLRFGSDEDPDSRRQALSHGSRRNRARARKQHRHRERALQHKFDGLESGAFSGRRRVARRPQRIVPGVIGPERAGSTGEPAGSRCIHPRQPRRFWWNLQCHGFSGRPGHSDLRSRHSGIHRFQPPEQPRGQHHSEPDLESRAGHARLFRNLSGRAGDRRSVER